MTVCKICSKRTFYIKDHIRVIHKMDWEDYRAQYKKIKTLATIMTPENMALIRKETHFYIHPQSIEPIREESKKNLCARHRRLWRRKATFLHAAVVPVQDICNEWALAEYMFEHYGFGIFNITTFKLMKNKYYKNSFYCRECSTRKDYFRGKSCPHNRKVTSNHGRIARISVFQADTAKGWDFKFDRSKNQMWHYKWWNNDIKREKLTAEDYY